MKKVAKSDSFRNRIKDPNRYAHLIDHIQRNLGLFNEPWTSIATLIRGLQEIFMGFYILEQSNQDNVSQIQNRLLNADIEEIKQTNTDVFFHDMSAGIVAKIPLYSFKIQLTILSFYALYMILGTIDISTYKHNQSGFLSAINRLVIGILTLMIISIFQPLFAFLIIQDFFFKDITKPQEFMGLANLVLASINAIIFLGANFFLMKTFQIKVAFIKNQLVKPESLYSLFITCEKLLLAATLLSYISSYSLGLNAPKFVLLIITFILSLLTLGMQLYYSTSFTIGKAIDHIASIASISLLITAIIFSTYIQGQHVDLEKLIFYSIQLIVGISIGYFFLYKILQHRKWLMLFHHKIENPILYSQALWIARDMLDDVFEKGIISKYTKNFLNLIQVHHHYCKDTECICQQSFKVLAKIRMAEYQENFQIQNEEMFILEHKGINDQDLGGLLGSYLNDFMVSLCKKAIEQFPNNLNLIHVCIDLMSNKQDFKYLGQQLMLINLKTSQFNFLQNVQLNQVELIVENIYITKVSKLSNWIDPHSLLEIHLLQAELYDHLQNLSMESIEFWKHLQSDTYSIYQHVKHKELLARTIIGTEQLLSHLEESGQDAGKTYYTLALMHKFVFNDMNQSDLYLKKLQSIKELKRLFQTNQNLRSGKQSFMIIDANPRNFGKILVANQNILSELGYKVGELSKGASIENLVPNAYSRLHQHFVNRMIKGGVGGKHFSQEGLSTFIRRKDDYLIYMQLNCQMFYHQQHGFIYLMKFQKQNQYLVDGENTKINLKDSMTFICEEDDFGIKDISETCYQKLAFDIKYLSTRELDTRKDKVSLYDILPESTILEAFEKHKSREFEQDIIELDASIIYKLLSNYRGINSQHVTAQLYLRRLIYQDHLQIETKNIYICNIVFISDETIASQDSINLKIKNSKRIQLQVFDDKSSIDSGVQSYSSSHSSSSSTSPENLKQFLSTKSNIENNSRSLKIILQLVIIVFIIMMGISTLNLGLTLKRHKNQKSELQIVKKSYERLIYNSKVRVFTRSLINMGNGYGSFSSNLLKDRYGQFQKLNIKQLELLKKTLDDLDIVEFNQEFGFKQDSTPMIMWYLDEQGNQREQNYTYSQGYNLLIAKTIELSNWPHQRLNGSTYLQKIGSNTNKPTEDERQVFFVEFNMFEGVRRRNLNYAEYYQQTTKLHALALKSQNLITAMISVGSIIVIGFTLMPIMSRFYKRKYQSVRFFTELQDKDVVNMIQNCQIFMNQMEQNENLKQKKIIEKARKYRKKMLQKKKENDLIHYQQKHNLSGAKLLTINQPIQHLSQATSLQDNEDLNEQNSNEFLTQNLDTKIIGVQQSEMNSQEEKKEELIEEIQNDNEPKVQLTPEQILEQEKLEQEAFDIKKEIRQQLNISAQHRVQSQVIIVLLLIVTFLSSYFIGTFLLTLKTFNEVPKIIDNLLLLYFRDASINQFISFVREDQIRNESILLRAWETDSGEDEIGSLHAYEQIMTMEENFRQLQRDMPIYFKEAAEFLDGLENNFCNTVIQDSDLEQVDCENAYNGLMKLGYTEAISNLLSHFQKEDLKFRSKVHRDLPFLQSVISNQISTTFIEINQFLLGPSAKELKEKVTQSTLKYYDNLRYYYLAIFVVFSVILSIAILLFLIYPYQRMKYQAQLTIQAFKIMPLDIIKKDDLIQLKEFCLN